jgi:hypothetical protein
MPRANAASAKLIVMFLRMFIVFLLFDWANLACPSSIKARAACENYSAVKKFFLIFLRLDSPQPR